MVMEVSENHSSRRTSFPVIRKPEVLAWERLRRLFGRRSYGILIYIDVL